MAFFLFGKKKKSKSRKTTKKPPAAILKKCRKLKIKTTKKVGSKRVYKSVSMLKKLIRRKSKKTHRKSHRKSHRRSHRRSGFGKIKSRFQFGSAGEFTNSGPSDFGYNQKVMRRDGILNQSSQIIVDAAANAARPNGMIVDASTKLPIYGVGRPFFTETVPTQIAPEWNAMGQPDGSMYNVGGPFVGYSAPAAFGRMRRYRARRRVRRN
jgi:hypothetical protein